MTAHPDPVQFDYVARDPRGSRRKGQLTASSSAHVAEQLRAKGLFPVHVAQAKPKAQLGLPLPGRSDRPLSTKQQADLLARLAKLAEARVPLDRALGLMARGEGRLPGVAAQMRQQMREGEPFPNALQSTANITDPATLALIRGSELSGDLPAALNTASELMARRLAAIRKMVTSLIYPVLLLVVAIGALALILGVIIPEFRPLVEDRLDLVPPLGRAVFALSALLSASWPVLTGAALIGGFAGWLMHRRGRLLPSLRAGLARLPYLRDVARQAQITVALDVLAALLARDVVLSDALGVVTRTAPEGPVRKGLVQTSQAVATGVPLSDALAAERIATAEVAEMIRIGEETGDIPTMIDRAAREMRARADQSTERLLALFQPALILIVGLLVGVCLYALFSAITAVNSIAF